MYLGLLTLPCSTLACLVLFGRNLGARGTVLLSVLSASICTAISFMIFYEVALCACPCRIDWADFITVELFDAGWGLLFDSLTALMCVVVALISALVIVYSCSYMIGDAHFIRFVSYLHLFILAMLILVTSNNYVQLFVGWEGVGLASFLLISFWFNRLQATKASMQAMLVNRVGDLFLALGIATLYFCFKTTDYSTLFCTNVCGFAAFSEFSPFSPFSAFCRFFSFSPFSGFTGFFSLLDKSLFERSLFDLSPAQFKEFIEFKKYRELSFSPYELPPPPYNYESLPYKYESLPFKHLSLTYEYLDKHLSLTYEHLDSYKLLPYASEVEKLMGLCKQSKGFWGWSYLDIACVLLLLGAAGKSGQLGLHIWLPNAMNAPTPVSALLHAATMVTAGVFLLARSSALLEYAPNGAAVVVILGSITALAAGTMNLVQHDFKGVIAYSTCSQLGYMVAICGLSNYALGIFHLFNHAFMKALLFLTSGVVIHAFVNEQDIRKFGSLQATLVFTYCMFLIGTLSLVGTPFLTGFYSKDVILELASVRYGLVANLGFLLFSFSVFTTSFYSFRLLFMIFFGAKETPYETNLYKYIQKSIKNHISIRDPWPFANRCKVIKSHARENSTRVGTFRHKHRQGFTGKPPTALFTTLLCKADREAYRIGPIASAGNPTAKGAIVQLNTNTLNGFNFLHLHDADWIMGLVLILLACGSLYAGWCFQVMFLGLGTDFWNNSLVSRQQNSYLLEAEFVPLSIKLIPLFNTIAGAFFAYGCTIQWSYWSSQFSYKYARSFYVFFNQRLFYDKLVNEILALSAYRLGFHMIKTFDKGLLCLFPFCGLGLSQLLKQAYDQLGQSGFINHYATIMVMSTLAALSVFISPKLPKLFGFDFVDSTLLVICFGCMCLTFFPVRRFLFFPRFLFPLHFFNITKPKSNHKF
jgi:NADH:ubiquinone oxidoreductase subunit 5 (subunit L)/multisubunit Na+/H+ antiporter MnhA subunit